MEAAGTPRVFLSMVFDAGLDYREIAMVTGVPIGTVMSRLARARRRLIAEVNAREQ